MKSGKGFCRLEGDETIEKRMKTRRTMRIYNQQRVPRKQENEKRKEERESKQNMEEGGATYGAWEEGTLIEEDFWDKYI